MNGLVLLHHVKLFSKVVVPEMYENMRYFTCSVVEDYLILTHMAGDFQNLISVLLSFPKNLIKVIFP